MFKSPCIGGFSRIIDDLNRFGFFLGYRAFDGDTVDGDLDKWLILVSGEAQYTWCTTLGEILS